MLCYVMYVCMHVCIYACVHIYIYMTIYVCNMNIAYIPNLYHHGPHGMKCLEKG